MLVSSLAPKETMDRLEAEIKAQGMMRRVSKSSSCRITAGEKATIKGGSI
jgi:hypothetical protein